MFRERGNPPLLLFTNTSDWEIPQSSHLDSSSSHTIFTDRTAGSQFHHEPRHSAPRRQRDQELGHENDQRWPYPHLRDAGPAAAHESQSMWPRRKMYVVVVVPTIPIAVAIALTCH